MNTEFYVYKAVFEDVDDQLEIRLWSVTKDGKTVCVRVEDYAFYIYLELSKKIKWNKSKIANFVEKLGNALKNHAPVDFKKVSKAKLYYAKEVCEDSNIDAIELYFDSIEAAKHCRNYVNKWKQKEITAVYESDPSKEIDPLKKMFVESDSTLCDWFEAPLEFRDEKDARTSDGIYDATVSWTDLKLIPKNICEGWVPQLKILGFDIETEGSEPGSLPEKWRPGDTVYLISCIFQDIRKPETRKRYGITFMDYDDSVEYEDEKIPEPGEEKKKFCEMLKVENEFEGFEAMAELIQIHQPHILTGHNVNGYDWDYIDSRINRKKKDRRKWPIMGMLAGERPEMITKRWQSSGAGDIKLRYPSLEGRVIVDTYTYFLRNFKLPKYNLDTVAKKYLNEGKHQIEVREQQSIVKAWRDLVKFKKTYEKRLRKSDGKEETLRKLESRKAKIARTEPEVLAENKRLIRYCIQDSELPVRLFDKLNIDINVAAMSNVSQIAMEEILCGGEQRKCRSMLYTFVRKEDYIMTPRGKQERGEYEGALVQDPVTGLWDVITLDFSSMYPSNIIAYNICHTTLIPKDTDVDDSMCNIIVDETGKPTGEKFWRQPKPVPKGQEQDPDDEGREGLVPKCVRILISKRGFYKKWMEQYETSPGTYDYPPDKASQFAVYNAMQEKIKVIANSFYGFMGAKTNIYSLFEGAASITAMGRYLITLVNNHVISKYNGRIIYGDTDSVMVYIEVNDPSEYYELGNKIADEITKIVINKPPVKISYEKSMRMIILKKKYYVAALYRKDGTLNLEPNKIMTKGVLSSRRDYCKWGQKLFSAIALDILSLNGFYKTMENVVAGIARLAAGKAPIEELTIIKRVTSKANDDYWVKRIALREIERGKQIGNGDRIEFVVTQMEGKINGKKPGVADKAVLIEDYSPETHKLDFSYYLEKQFMKQMDDMLTKAFPIEFKIYSDDGYKPNSRRKYVPFTSPIKMIARMVEDGVNIVKKVKRILKPIQIVVKDRKSSKHILV